MSRTQKIFQSLMMMIMILIPCFGEASGRCVILIHGLSRTHYSMAKLARYLQAHDYTVVNKSYASNKMSVKDIADKEISLMVNACLKHKPDNIYFVTHSIGGLVLRHYLQTHKVAKIARIVMLGPPNHGSPLADIFHKNLLYKLMLGPAGQELTSQSHSLPDRLDPDVPYQVGIIAGNFNFFPFMKLFFHEENDGKVAITSTKLTGMNDFIILPVNHTFIMRNTRVAEQILHFFDHAKFIHPAAVQSGGPYSLRRETTGSSLEALRAG